MTDTAVTPTTGGVQTDTGTTFSGNVRAVPNKIDVDDLLDSYDEPAAEETAKATKEATKQPPEVDTPGKPVEAKAEEPAQEEAEPEAEPTEPPKNVIRAKVGDEDLDIPEDATITQEINGKKVQFQIKDAVRALAGQEQFNRAMDSRLSRLNAKEQEHIKQVRVIQERLRDLTERAQDGDVFGLFQMAADMGKRDPVEFERQMLANMNKIHERFSRMSPEQQEAFFANRKAAFLEKKFKEIEEKTQYEQAVTHLEMTVNERCRAEGVDREIFDGLFHQIVEQFVGKQPFNQKQLTSPDDISVDDVFLYKDKLDMIQKVERAVERAAPDKANPEFILKVLNVVGNDFDLTEADIAELLQSGGISLKTPAQENLAQKAQLLEKKGFGAQSLRGQASSNTKQNPGDEDDLWEEFVRKRR